jgi:hypothetical protein
MDSKHNTLIRGHTLLSNYVAGDEHGTKPPYKVIKMDSNLNLSQEPLIQSHEVLDKGLDEEISAWVHELSQSLLVMNTYISGCMHRLEQNRLNNDQVLEIIKKIAEQIKILGIKIHRMKKIDYE